MKVEIVLKAGIMKDVNGSVSADPRKGWLVVTREDDELLRLYWKERKEAEFDHQGQALLLEESAEECLVLFPEDAELIHLRDKPGRIFLLKFHTSAKRVFFWMQESSSEHDESNCNKINSLISGLFSTDDDDINGVINAANSVDAMLIDAGVAEASPSSSLGTRKSFSQLLDMKKVAEFVKQNPDIHDDLKKLLPEEIDFDASAIERVVRGPFFRQSLSLLDNALDNGHLPNLLVQFGIPLNSDLISQFGRKSGSEIFLLSMVTKLAEKKETPPSPSSSDQKK